MGHCNYDAFFNAKGGKVILEISKLAGILISYENSENSLINTKEKEESTKDDL